MNLRSLFVSLMLGWCTITLGRAAEPAPFARDLAVYDHVLAGVKPGETRVRFGDVGVTVAQLREFRARLAAMQAATLEGKPLPLAVTPAGTAFKWPGGNVYYRFDAGQVSGGTITALKQQQFRDGVAEWAAWANLHFIEFTGTPPANFITVQQNSTGTEGGYSSSVGMAGGEQFLQFGNGSWNRGTICHEVGHALGLWHEQQRPDRDTYVMIHPENLADPNDGNFTIVPTGQTFGTAYDFYSVMHYRRDASSINGQDTITMRAGSTQYINVIGAVYDRTLSTIERAGMATIYGNPATLPSATVTNTNDGGPGSLRTAIYYAFDRSSSASPTPTTIVFHIPTSDPNYSGGVFRIKPTFELVALGNGTTLDGTTQTAFTGDTNPNGPEVVLDGSNFTALSGDPFYFSGRAVLLRAANCTVRGLTITNFTAAGVDIFAGIDPNGSASTGNVIDSNRISACGSYGIEIRNATTAGNTVRGNYIGTDQTGASAQPNLGPGVVIFNGATGNTIGGTTAAARNVISGNMYQGVLIGDTGTTGNAVVGNYIGTNAAGTAAIANGTGAEINNGAQSNAIGGTAAGSGNLLSGNTYQGVAVDGTGTMQNVVQGNLIGTDKNGTAAVQNGSAGLSIFSGAQANTIGGTVVAARNVISGNFYQGVTIDGAATSGNFVRGNYIGTNLAGTTALPNNSSGLSLFNSAHDNIVGGVIPGAGNVISGNTYQEISMDGASTTGNLVQGNFIGLDATGLNTIANSSSGVDIFGAAHGNVVGGTAPGARNFIAGNTYYGVSISGIGTTANLVQGNTIGLNVAGAADGNGFASVALFPPCCPAATPGPQGNTIGGSAPGASNLISGNLAEGIGQYDASTKQNTFSRNSINANGYAGIGVYDGSNNAQPHPMIASAVLGPAGNVNGTDVGGSFSGSASTLEFFASPTADPSGFGEGQHYLGSLGVSGAGNFTAHLVVAVPAGYVVSATSTDSLGDTSDFSNAFTVTSTDNGNDGLTDAWMTLYFGHIDPRANDNSRAGDDADGDGLTNLQEFRAGTDPKNPASRFRMTAATRGASDVTVTFASVVGKTYRVEYKNDLLATNWSLLSDQVAATGTTTAVTDNGAASLAHRFYRAVIEP